jgi:cob(I)alamin adenosyltransferase
MGTVFYTGQGDEGTSRIGKNMTAKDDAVFFALGALDELNSWIGFTSIEAENSDTKAGIPVVLKNIQEILFIAQAEVYATKADLENRKQVDFDHTVYLEEVIKKIDSSLPRIDKFVVPGGTELAARLDYARTLARRAERLVLTFNNITPVSPHLLQFLNRLSSLFFALARFANHHFGVQEDHPHY